MGQPRTYRLRARDTGAGFVEWVSPAVSYDGYPGHVEGHLDQLTVLSDSPPPCEHCGQIDGVELEPTRTAYAYPTPNAWRRLLWEDEGLSGTPPDPNSPSWLCRKCAVEYHEYWDEMWSNVPR
jgi:hypothetical protein